MKKYVVMCNYGSEGWKIHAQVDTFPEAWTAREEAKGALCSEVVIFKNVEVNVSEGQGE